MARVRDERFHEVGQQGELVAEALDPVGDQRHVALLEVRGQPARQRLRPLPTLRGARVRARKGEPCTRRQRTQRIAQGPHDVTEARAGRADVDAHGGPARRGEGAQQGALAEAGWGGDDRQRFAGGLRQTV